MTAYNTLKPTNRREVANSAAEIEGLRSERTRAPETLEEDKSFLNHLKTAAARDYSTEEVQRLCRIAERGIKTRCAVDKAIANISDGNTRKSNRGRLITV